MTRFIAALLTLLMLAGAAHAFGFGLGNRFGKMGAFPPGKHGASPGCTMNGIFDLTNTCNDIYFIGALR